MTLARRPVPRLDGQVPRKPRLSDHMSFVPWDSATDDSFSEMAQKRVKTSLTSPLSAMEMMRQ